MMYTLMLMAMILLAVAVVQWFASRPAKLPRVMGDWGSADNDDPRVALAAMMYAVAAEAGTVSPAQEELMLAVLTGNIGLDAKGARESLRHGRRLAQITRREGDLTSRLHRMKAPIAKHCSQQEREDVIDVLREIAGSSARQVGSVRDAIGRLAATLLHA